MSAISVQPGTMIRLRPGEDVVPLAPDDSVTVEIDVPKVQLQYFAIPIYPWYAVDEVCRAVGIHFIPGVHRELINRELSRIVVIRCRGPRVIMEQHFDLTPETRVEAA